MANIKVAQFGKDHWSLLAYVESCCVDGQSGVGVLVRTRMRCNPQRNPLLSHGGAWRDSYGTRLAGHAEFADRHDVAKSVAAGLLVPHHDDWDCLDDLKAAGLVEAMSLEPARVRLTEEGLKVAACLRTHKAQGGHFSAFCLRLLGSAP